MIQIRAYLIDLDIEKKIQYSGNLYLKGLSLHVDLNIYITMKKALLKLLAAVIFSIFISVTNSYSETNSLTKASTHIFEKGAGVSIQGKDKIYRGILFGEKFVLCSEQVGKGLISTDSISELLNRLNIGAFRLVSLKGNSGKHDQIVRIEHVYFYTYEDAKGSRTVSILELEDSLNIEKAGDIELLNMISFSNPKLGKNYHTMVRPTDIQGWVDEYFEDEEKRIQSGTDILLINKNKLNQAIFELLQFYYDSNAEHLINIGAETTQTIIYATALVYMSTIDLQDAAQIYSLITLLEPPTENSEEETKEPSQ